MPHGGMGSSVTAGGTNEKPLQTPRGQCLQQGIPTFAPTPNTLCPGLWTLTSQKQRFKLNWTGGRRKNAFGPWEALGTVLQVRPKK